MQFVQFFLIILLTILLFGLGNLKVDKENKRKEQIGMGLVVLILLALPVLSISSAVQEEGEIGALLNNSTSKTEIVNEGRNLLNKWETQLVQMDPNSEPFRNLQESYDRLERVVNNNEGEAVLEAHYRRWSVPFIRAYSDGNDGWRHH